MWTKEKQAAYSKEWRQSNKQRVLAYRQTPYGRFIMHRANAKTRGIEWELSFEEWWNIWESSGKWNQRGPKGEQYCMCRNGDKGPYAVHNVRIDTTVANIKERHGTN